MLHLVALIILFLSLEVKANPQIDPVPWVKVPIPGAVCARGEPYHVYLKYRSPEKMTIGFQAGGACWSFSTCSHLSPLAKLSPKRGVDPDGALKAPDLRDTVMSDSSMIYFPYCTGDVFTGMHVADYGRFSINHFGAENVRKTMMFLKEESYFDFNRVNRLIQYGSSAGAVGAIAHIRLMENYFPNASSKVLLADSPGLHWGKKFWNRFESFYRADMIAGLEAAGALIDDEDGNVAKNIDVFCNSNPSWNIGFLQSTKDIVMSLVFGQVNPWKHRKKVLGPEGLFQTIKTKTKNCSVYLNDGFLHIFFDKVNQMSKTVQGVTPQQFFRKIVAGESQILIPQLPSREVPEKVIDENEPNDTDSDYSGQNFQD